MNSSPKHTSSAKLAPSALAGSSAAKKRLALFDLDDTILAGDSDHLWGLHLIQCGKVAKATYLDEHLSFKDDYHQGRLDMHAYTEFSTRPLRTHPLAELIALRKQFTEKTLAPLIRPPVVSIMRDYQRKGYTVLIITATNEFVVTDICQELPAQAFLATELEQKNGAYTGKIKGTPSFQRGKWTRLQAWLAQHPDHTLAESTFYSDSANDRFLLEKVAYPVVVNGDTALRTHAKRLGWKMMMF